MPGILLKEHWRTKTYRVTGFVRAEGRRDVASTVDPDGWTIPLTGTAWGNVWLTFPGQVSVGINWDYYTTQCPPSSCNCADYLPSGRRPMPGHPDYVECENAGDGELLFGTEVSGVVSSPPNPSNLESIPLNWDWCYLDASVYSTYPDRWMSDFTYTRTFDVTVTLDCNLYADVINVEDTLRYEDGPPNYYTGYWTGYPSDRDGGWLQDKRVRYYEMATVHVSVQSGSWSWSGTAEGGLRQVDQNDVQIIPNVESLYGVGPQTGSTYTSCTVYRSHSRCDVDAIDWGSHVYSETLNYTTSWDDTHVLQAASKSATITVNTNTISLSGTWDILDVSNGEVVGCTLTDYASPYTVTYTGHSRYVDGSAPFTDAQYQSQYEMHPAYTQGVGWDLNVSTETWGEAGTVEQYAWWEIVEGDSWVIKATDDWAIADGHVQYLNMPSYYTATNQSYDGIHFDVLREYHGGVRVTNTDMLKEPHHDPPPVAGTPAYYDRRVLLMHTDLPELSWTAGTMTIAATGDIPNPPLVFDDTTGWTVSGCTLTDAGSTLSVTNVVAGAYITRDYSADNIRLTGTRYARVYWSASAAGQQLKITVNGLKWWKLTADVAGARSDIIDLCRPNWEAGGTSGDLQRGTLGGLTKNSAGKLVHCSGATGPGDEQQQTIVDVEKPDEPGAGTWDHTLNWGVGKVTSVRFDFLTAGETYDLNHVALHRKDATDGGYCRFVAYPQFCWNDDRDIKDYSLYASGTSSVGTTYDEYYRMRGAWVEVDGAVVLEICPIKVTKRDVLGEPARYITLSEPTHNSTWPAYPLDDYATPTQVACNGVISITPNAQANLNLFLQTYGLLAHLDYVDASVSGTHNITCTLRTDDIEIPVGFGSISIEQEKYFRTRVSGLWYHLNSPVLPGEPLEVTDSEGATQQIMPNPLGVIRSNDVACTGDATVGGYLTSKVRSRLMTRAIVTT